MNELAKADWLLATWQLQVALGSGYAAYMIAYTGIRSHHQTIDTTFRTIAFGLVATAVLLSVSAAMWKPATIAAAFLATVTSGILWRRWGMTGWSNLLRYLDLTWSDDTPSAWAKFSQDQDHYVTQLTVVTTDGRVLVCDDTRPFERSPQGPCVLGTSGDLTMYVTHSKAVGEANLVESDSPDLEGWGARLTYVPAGKIERLEIRRSPKPPVQPFWKRWLSRSRPAASADGSAP